MLIKFSNDEFFNPKYLVSVGILRYNDIWRCNLYCTGHQLIEKFSTEELARKFLKKLAKKIKKARKNA